MYICIFRKHTSIYLPVHVKLFLSLLFNTERNHYEIYIKITCTALLFIGLMAGCNENTAPKQEKSALEKNAMHYGEIFKNEYYRATVENAKFEKIDKE